MDAKANAINSTLPKFIKKITRLLDKNDYQELESYYKEISEDQVFLKTNREYLLWVESIIASKNYSNYDFALELCDEALSQIDDALPLNNFSHNLKFNLINAKANYLISKHEYADGIDLYKEALTLIEGQHKYTIEQIKILFYLARTYAIINDYIESNFYAERALHLSTQTEHLKYVDSIYHLLAEKFISLGKYDIAKQHLDKSRFVAELKNNTSLFPFINRSENTIEQYFEQ
ncbi:hypothetical protein IU402_06760 [Aerococcaceae bacterium zg-BR9]|uniref:hypothetical protein n=1 Tax=Aerococcaceae bacterium zg-1292 TaxID=2774330 RepID=UPI0040630F2E|nr:hypothetical protein [Aerococcaceae bacterium zg-BR9]MBF6626275.1 hypothetical protein [Aerococcaceae bacterium zg-BR9]